MNDLDRILDGLIQRTAEGKLKWSPSIRLDSFITSVGAISVVLRQLHWSTSESYRLEIQEPTEGVTIAVLESQNASDKAPPSRRITKEQAQQLQHLYDLVSGSVLDVDGTLTKLADALEAR